MAVLDFFKKDPENKDSDNNVQNTPNAGDTSPSTDTTQTTTTQQTTQTTAGGTGGSYNGIGSPPSGQSYNGIGSPPTPQAPTQTTTTTQQTTTTPGINQGAQTPMPAAQSGQNMQTPPSTPPATQNADTQAPGAGASPQSQTPQGQDQQIPTQDGTDQQAGQAVNQDQTSQDPNAQKKDMNSDQMQSTIDNSKRSQLDLMTHLTQRSNRVFATAQQKAEELKSDMVDSEHVLHGLLADPEVFKIFTDVKVQPQIIEQELEKLYKKGDKEVKPQMSPRVKKIMDDALVTARKLGYEFISPEHILLAVFDEGEGVGARVLAKLGVKKEDLNKKVTGKKKGLDSKAGDAQEASVSTLEQYTKDLTAQAQAGQLDPVVERADVIERTIHIISRRTKNNPVLVGEAGVGKTAVVEGLAQKIASKEVPESLMNKRILQLDLMSVLAGASHRGEFEERMKKIIEEITASQGSIILFIDEIHNLVGAGAGGSGSLDASNFLKPSLARGELQMIGATTLTEYRKYIEKDPALERRFQPVMTPEPNVESAIKMLKSTRDKYEAFHKVKIPDEAIEAAVKLSKRYVGDRFLPDKAVDLIDEAGSAVRLPLISLPEEIRSLEERIAQLQQEHDEAEKRGDRVRTGILKPKLEDLKAELKAKQDKFDAKKSQSTAAVSEQAIKDIIARWTGIPVSKITESETDKLTKLEDIIHERLINQDAAVEPVAQAIRRGRAGLKSSEKPIGSFVFLGPTGVGKTELSKTLAEILFGQEEALIRFDMTEYMEKHEVAKLLGAPPGYVGYEEGGKLTEAVRRRPYSVVLFDEIEKAHPDIFNILLQVLDDGRLTDNKGHVISFKNTVLICTSNIGTKLIQDEILASGQVDIEEPTALSTYAFSPRGRQIMTIMGKVFEREDKTDPWSNMMLIDYFSGQKIVEEVKAQSEEGAEETSTKDSTIEFPGKEFDTHAMSPKGEEIITVGEQVYMRTSTTAKEWTAKSLIDFFKNGVVINALPDAPEQQLPTAKLKTHTFSPSEEEIVSYRDRFWKRKGDTQNWETGSLKDYFEGHTLNQPSGTASTDASAETEPKQSQPMQDKPAEMKVDDQEQNDTQNSENQTEQQNTDTQQADQNSDASANQPATNAPTPKASQEKSDVQKPEVKTDAKSDEKLETFPTNYWDIHGFTAEGKEFIIVGEKIWVREVQATTWNVMPLENFFSDDFPLAKELEEKKKIEDELEKNQYNKIKAKVMTELGKFFRPELINRFDEVTIFEPLRYRHMLQISELQLKAVRKLMEEQNMGFDWTESAKKEIVRQGFDPIFGARPLKRTIQKLVENPISSLIIEQKVSESDMVVVDFDGAKFVFNIEKVKFVKKSELEKKKIRKFMCTTSRHEFETEVVKTAQVICPIDANEPVQEIVEESETETSDTPQKTDAESGSSDAKENSAQSTNSDTDKTQQPPQNQQQNANQQQGGSNNRKKFNKKKKWKNRRGAMNNQNNQQGSQQPNKPSGNEPSGNGNGVAMGRPQSQKPGSMPQAPKNNPVLNNEGNGTQMQTS